MAHPFGIFGLCLTMIGTALLLKFPPGARGYQPDGSWHGWWAVRATPEGKRQYVLLTRGYRGALCLMIIGFALQLMDLMLT